MYHYFGTTTTTRGDSLVGWQIEVITLDPVPTVVPIYADENSTPISVVSHVINRAVSNIEGNYDFFVEDGIYSIRFYNENGAPQGDGLRYVIMSEGGGGSGGAPTLSYEFPPATAGQSIFVYPGGGGTITAVYVNGGRIASEDYSVAGTATTLAEACDAGDIVVVIVGEGDDLGSEIGFALFAFLSTLPDEANGDTIPDQGLYLSAGFLKVNK